MSTDTTARASASGIPAAARPAESRPPSPPTWVLKVCMAVTGAIFAAFVVFHMAGNLKVYLGREDFDHYAHWLRTLLNPLVPGETFLWIFRAVLLAALICHVYAGLTIWARARKARGAFRRTGMSARRIAPRTMIATGTILLCFIIFHILDLTVGAPPAGASQFVAGSAYDNLVYSFQRPPVAIFYMLTMALLAFHLAHGLRTVVNDFGVTGRRLRAICIGLGELIAAVVAVGNFSIPLAVLAGWVTL